MSLRINDFIRRNIFAILALLVMSSAQSYWITLAAVCVGIVFDRLRNRFGIDYEQIIARFEASGRDLKAVPRQRWRMLIPILYGVWATYIVGFFYFQTHSPESTVRAYLEPWDGLHQLMMALFYMPRDHFSEMVAQGYEYRALVTVHAYSIANVFMVPIAALWIWLGGYPGPLQNMTYYYSPVRNGSLRHPMSAWAPFAVLLLLLALHLPLTLLVVEFYPNSVRDWIPHLSNSPLIIYQSLCAGYALLLATPLASAELVNMWMRYLSSRSDHRAQQS